MASDEVKLIRPLPPGNKIFPEDRGFPMKIGICSMRIFRLNMVYTMPEFRIAVSVSTFSWAGIQDEFPVRMELTYIMYLTPAPNAEYNRLIYPFLRSDRKLEWVIINVSTLFKALSKEGCVFKEPVTTSIFHAS